jgi:ribonuclease HI
MVAKTIQHLHLSHQKIAEEQHQEAAESNSNNPNLLDVYTDGSGIEEQIGAAAYAPKTSATTYEYLGPNTTANVFTAELTGIKLATAIFDDQDPSNFTACSIYVDSQAALKALNKPGRQSGQYIIAEIIADIENIKRRKQMDLTMGWIPSHEGIPGNEKVDVEAKKAALGKVRRQVNNQLWRLKSAQIRDINKRTATLATEKPD